MAKDKPMASVMVEKMPNTLHLDEDELPEIKDWKVGQKYTIELEVEQTGLHKGGMMDSGDKKYSADFKIVKVSVAGEDTPEEEAKESKSVEDKEQSNKVANAIRRKFNSK